MKALGTLDARYVDEQYRLWKRDPESVSTQWRFFFEGFELGWDGQWEPPSRGGEDGSQGQAAVEDLIHRHRDLGHLLACLDPLAACPTQHPLLSLEACGLTPADLEKRFVTPFPSGDGKAPLRDILAALRETYCRRIGVEYMHLQDPGERLWLRERMEPNRNRPALDAAKRRRVLEALCEAALFEQFLNRKYLGVTRFSLEGADGIIPLLDALLERVAQKGCREVVLAMAHRGRLNVQAHILGKPYEDIFGEFESCYDPGSLVGSGDVKYHRGYMAGAAPAGLGRLRIHMPDNPSHLEAVGPVAEGIVRGRQDGPGGGGKAHALAVLLHGDAAFAGQGVVAETLNLSQLKGYGTGGTIHVVINNQIGYTTLPENARSTRYSTDVAKMLMVPIFHVHGEDPEALVHVAGMAADYRWEFGKDVVVDVVCYRRHGHNEGDEPYFTQPLMYDRIRARPSLHRIYGERLMEASVLEKAAFEAMGEAINDRLERAHRTIDGSDCPFPASPFYEQWDGLHGEYGEGPARTAVSKRVLLELTEGLGRLPEDFSVHPKVKSLMERRSEAVRKGAGIDWAHAEALAFASLLAEGTPIRLSGQDSRRGTFSQRHSVVVDTATGKEHTPLNALSPSQAPFAAYDSTLAEASVLSFEYGYSTVRPDCLTIWEAQFGDFANNAQAAVDLFVASGQSKWRRLSGLVMLLPHGFEGLGPEHSSARIERFLQLCAEDNLQVCNVSTPAQYFHLLRRQMKRPFRKPLIVFTPKSLLRHPLAVSRTAELTGGRFRDVLEEAGRVSAPRRVLLCSGKIYYELFQHREGAGPQDTAIVRLEQFYPFPGGALGRIVARYAEGPRWYWVQEEPENMGAWPFLRTRLEAVIGKPVSCVAREAASSPATGFPSLHKAQQAALVKRAFQEDGQGG